MTIAITNTGKKIKASLNGGALETVYLDYNEISLAYRTGGEVIVSIQNSNGLSSNGRYVMPIANVTIGGVVITSQGVFDTQVAAVFV